ncbi:MAG: fatty acid desaturase family protein [Bacteroidota bacterium]
MNYTNVTFSKEHNSEFYKVLRQRVNDYFKSRNISRHANGAMVFKTICMMLIYLIPFSVLFISGLSNWIYLLCWAFMGVGMAGIGLSVMHDANHGAYSRNEIINNIIGKVIILVGGNDVNWRIQHNVLHHTYTNVTEIDEDIDPPAIFLRFSPHKKRLKIHRFQHIYAWFFYGLMTIVWFVSKDYKQAARYKKMGLVESQGLSYAKHLTTIITSKVFYAFIFLLLPFLLSPAHWYVTLFGYLMMQFISGFILAAIFQPAHVVPTSNYPMPDDSGNIDADWAVNQLYNTTNFAPKAKLFSWYVGGLNYQVEHHLFPNICHIHYSKIASIVRETAAEFNLPYYSYNTFYKALKEHTKMLYALGHQDMAPAIH